MKQKEYKIKIYSIGRFIVAMIGILLLGLIFILDNMPQSDSEIMSIIQFISIFASSIYLAHLVGMGKVKVVFTQEGIKHIWERKFILSREKSFIIPWKLVDNYVFQEDRTFDSFIINLTNKKRYKLDRLNFLPIKDDFNSLVKDFPKLSNAYKKGGSSGNATTKIKQGESIYANKSFKWVFYFMLAGFLFLTATKVFNPDSGTTWSSLGVIGSGLLFYGMMINGQKKNN